MGKDLQLNEKPWKQQSFVKIFMFLGSQQKYFWWDLCWHLAALLIILAIPCVSHKHIALVYWI